MEDGELSIFEFLEKAKENIIRIQSAKGLKASGKSADSLQVDVSGQKGELSGDASFFAQESGTKPGIKPDVNDIYDWLQYKKYKLSYKTDKGRWSLARAIVKKQYEQGSYIFRKKLHTGVLSDAVAKEMLEELDKKVSDFFVDGLVKDILKVFKTP